MRLGGNLSQRNGGVCAIDAFETTDLTKTISNARQTAALGMVASLAKADSTLRGGVAHIALAQCLRGEHFDLRHMVDLRNLLYRHIEDVDRTGYSRPFAALVLSELARIDRISPWMSADELDEMLSRAAAFLEEIRDYQVLDQDAGWCQGINSGCDWLMQLALNRALTTAQHYRVLRAVATQVAPAVPHAYIFGELERLARPVLCSVANAPISDADLKNWLSDLVVSIGTPDAGYSHHAWFVRRQDVRSFLTELYAGADRSKCINVRRFKRLVADQMDSLP